MSRVNTAFSILAQDLVCYVNLCSVVVSVSVCVRERVLACLRVCVLQVGG